MTANNSTRNVKADEGGFINDIPPVLYLIIPVVVILFIIMVVLN